MQTSQLIDSLRLGNAELEARMEKICGCERGRNATMTDPSSSAVGLRPANILASFICRFGSRCSTKAKASILPAADLCTLQHFSLVRGLVFGND